MIILMIKIIAISQLFSGQALKPERDPNPERRLIEKAQRK
jgi:hypothetical protein